MKSTTEYLTFCTKEKRVLINITSKVEEVVQNGEFDGCRPKKVLVKVLGE